MPDASPFKRPRPLVLRLWHWLDALAILGSLGTVLLRKTFLSWRTNSALIEAKVNELGGAIATDDAVTIAKAIRAPMWDWHYTFGFAIAALLVVRVLLGLWDADHAPVRATLRELARFVPLPPAEKAAGAHHLAVKLLYLLFYVVLAFMVASGLSMYYADALGLSEGLLEWLKEAHELAMWFFVGFLGLHVGGVVVAEVRGEAGLVSDMINGGAPRP